MRIEPATANDAEPTFRGGAFMSPTLAEIIGERQNAVQSLETGGGAIWHAAAI
jgi:hypothetical protein